jgi:hypothetical protein
MSKKKVKVEERFVAVEHMDQVTPKIEGADEAMEDANGSEVKTPSSQGIGKFIMAMILETGGTNAQILETVHKAFPTCKTSMACIAWYKSKLRREGKIPARVSKQIPVGEANPQLES